MIPKSSPSQLLHARRIGWLVFSMGRWSNPLQSRGVVTLGVYVIALVGVRFFEREYFKLVDFAQSVYGGEGGRIHMLRPGRRSFLSISHITPWIIVFVALVSGEVQAESALRSKSRSFSGEGVEARFLNVMRRIDESHVEELVGAERWHQLKNQYVGRITSAKTHDDFARVLNAMFHEAAISHFTYVTDRHWSYWHLRGDWEPSGDAAKVAHVGLVTEEISGKWFVRGVLESSPASGRGILVGDELVSVDGVRYAEADSFKGKERQPVVVKLRRDPQTTYDVQLTPVRENYALAIQQAMIQSIQVIEYGNKKFAYAHVWTLLAPPTVFRRLSLLEHDVDGLLLDFRDGVGGRSEAAMFFLLGKRSHSGRVPRITPWQKPVVILTDTGTRSAKEIVVDAVKRAGRAVLVGSPTPGEVSAVDVERTGAVGDDGFLLLPWFRFPLEGHPVQPDFLVPRRLPYCAGYDPQIALAKDVLTASLVAH